MKINPGQKNLLHAKKEWWILVTYHALLKYTSFRGVDKRKKSIKRIWTISIWQIRKDPYQKILSGQRVDDRFSYAIFEIYIQTVFYPNSFLFFFGFNIVCQLLARFLSKEMKTMKNYSDRIKPFFAQIRPSFTLHVRIQLCCLVWRNESQYWSKKLAACKKKEWWILVTYHALLKYTSFCGVDKRKKSIKRIWTISIWQIRNDPYQ